MEKTYSFISSNNVNRIHVMLWLPEGEVKCILQISHGMVEHIGRYAAFAKYLNRFGILVVGNDHLGHGKSVASDDDLGYFGEGDASKNLVRDLHTVTSNMKKRYPNIPYFIMGHSMGSFLVRRYIMTYGDDVDGAILMGTGDPKPAAIAAGKALVKGLVKAQGEHYRSTVVNKVMFGLYNSRIENKRTEKDWLTRDNAEVDKYLSDKKCNFIFTLNGDMTLLDTLTYIQNDRHIEKIPKDLPIYMVSGLSDPVGDYGDGVLHVFDHLKASGVSDVEIKLYDGCRHELLNETNKYEVFKDIKDWINEQQQIL